MQFTGLDQIGSPVPVALPNRYERVPALPASPRPALPKQPRRRRSDYVITRSAPGGDVPAPGARVFKTGWCGGEKATTCKDRAGRCKGYVRNGSRAARPVLYCGCACHSPADLALIDVN